MAKFHKLPCWGAETRIFLCNASFYPVGLHTVVSLEYAHSMTWSPLHSLVPSLLPCIPPFTHSLPICSLRTFWRMLYTCFGVSLTVVGKGALGWDRQEPVLVWKGCAASGRPLQPVWWEASLDFPIPFLLPFASSEFLASPLACTSQLFLFGPVSPLHIPSFYSASSSLGPWGSAHCGASHSITPEKSAALSPHLLQLLFISSAASHSHQTCHPFPSSPGSVSVHPLTTRLAQPADALGLLVPVGFVLAPGFCSLPPSLLGFCLQLCSNSFSLGPWASHLSSWPPPSSSLFPAFPSSPRPLFFFFSSSLPSSLLFYLNIFRLKDESA